jgi:hypothetical protein
MFVQAAHAYCFDGQSAQLLFDAFGSEIIMHIVI